ncbi:hypothetical protein [Streptomyces nigrescens]|nr:hypothetical protein [Streptomyces nigrescens]
MPKGLPKDMPKGLPTGMPGFPGLPGTGSDTGAGGGRAASGGTDVGGAGFDLMANPSLTRDQRRILDYAVRHAPAARIKLAMDGGAMTAAPVILESDDTVIAMGGFLGSDNAPSLRQLTAWTKSGELRYVLASGFSGRMAAMMPGQGKDSPAAQRSAWISEHCAKVPASTYGSSSGGSDPGAGGKVRPGGGTLYDCAPEHRKQPDGR